MPNGKLVRLRKQRFERVCNVRRFDFRHGVRGLNRDMRSDEEAEFRRACRPKQTDTRNAGEIRRVQHAGINAEKKIRLSYQSHRNG